MNFKEQYLSGLCGIDHIDACIEQWHQLPEDGVRLTDYLGLTQQEYDVFLQTDLSTTFQQILTASAAIRDFGSTSWTLRTARQSLSHFPASTPCIRPAMNNRLHLNIVWCTMAS